MSVQATLLAVAVYALGALALVLRPGDVNALWWPGAGAAIVGLLVTDRRRWPVLIGALVVAGTLGNLTGGRPLTVSVLFGLINTAETVLVAGVLSYRRPDPRQLVTLTDLVRVVIAVAAGAMLAGLAVAEVGAWTVGADLLPTALTVAASHGSAMMVMLPLGLRTPRIPVEADRLEVVAQWASVIVVAGFVFAPGQVLPLAFLVPPTILWAALRSSLTVAGLQLLTCGVVTAGLTVRGHGPFAAADGLLTAPTLLQLLVASSASLMLAAAVTGNQRRAALAKVSRQEELFRVGFTEALLGLLLLRDGPDGLRIVELNDVAARLLGDTSGDLVGARWGDLLAPDDRDRVHEAVAAMRTNGDSGWHAELLITRGGRARWCEVAISPAVEGTDGTELRTVQMVDVTARREAEQRLSDLALRDGLTGLANRILLDERLESAIADARRSARFLGILFLDLDGFKQINDLHGHATGDRLLTAIGGRLRHALREVDTVARVGGDEFVVLCPDLATPDDLAGLVARVRGIVDAPVELDGVQVRCGVSIGSTVGDGASDPRELLLASDIAMYAEKRASNGRLAQA